MAIFFLAVVWLGISAFLNEGAIGALYVGLTLRLYVLAPWSAINLIDYFILRRRLYAVLELQKPNGLYGQWNFGGLASYAAGLASGIPFFNLPGYFTGPAATAMGGVDIAWLPELLVAAGLYAAFNRRTDFKREWELAKREEDSLDLADIAAGGTGVIDRPASG